MEKILLFSLTQEISKKMLSYENELVVKLAEEIKEGSKRMIDGFDPEKYSKARPYIINFYQNSLLQIFTILKKAKKNEFKRPI